MPSNNYWDLSFKKIITIIQHVAIFNISTFKNCERGVIFFLLLESLQNDTVFSTHPLLDCFYVLIFLEH